MWLPEVSICKRRADCAPPLIVDARRQLYMLADKSTLLIEMARGIAAENPRFQDVLGPGAGDHHTNAFIQRLRDLALGTFGRDYSEKRICGETSLAVDFYFPEEETIVEVALGLPNPSTEFEKDVLKAVIADETGTRVRKLILISRAGGAKKCSQPGRTAVKSWARSKHSLAIEVHDLPGEPRKRKRRRKATTIAAV